MSLLNIQKINICMLNKLYSVGWNVNRHIDSVFKYINQMIRYEGYVFFEYAYAIITNLDGITLGFTKEELARYKLTSYYGEIEFSISNYGVDIFEPIDLKTRFFENVVPFGAINGQIILLVGESQRIYADVGNAGYKIVGENIEDFLNRCVQ